MFWKRLTLTVVWFVGLSDILAFSQVRTQLQKSSEFRVELYMCSCRMHAGRAKWASKRRGAASWFWMFEPQFEDYAVTLRRKLWIFEERLNPPFCHGNMVIFVYSECTPVSLGFISLVFFYRLIMYLWLNKWQSKLKIPSKLALWSCTLNINWCMLFLPQKKLI